MTENIATKQTNELVSISRILISVVLVIQMSGCGGHVYHVVEPGETLYSIGWLYGYDYREIAQWNKLTSLNGIRKGQRIRVAPPKGASTLHQRSKITARVGNKSHGPVAAKATKNRTPIVSGAVAKTNESETGNKTPDWHWPVKNREPLQTFDAKDPGKRGLDFTGDEGQAVYSAAAGNIVYSGAGLPRYGKLIIVKHSDEYLSAYAHNKRLLVKEGDEIRSGQHIADMGKNRANRTMLHFEIRRNGKPVDPLIYLPVRDVPTERKQNE